MEFRLQAADRPPQSRIVTVGALLLHLFELLVPKPPAFAKSNRIEFDVAPTDATRLEAVVLDDGEVKSTVAAGIYARVNVALGKR